MAKQNVVLIHGPHGPFPDQTRSRCAPPALTPVEKNWEEEVVEVVKILAPHDVQFLNS